MANRKMKMSKPKAHQKQPTPTAVYKKRSAKPEADDIPKRPARKRFGPPKGFI